MVTEAASSPAVISPSPAEAPVTMMDVVTLNSSCCDGSWGEDVGL